MRSAFQTLRLLTIAALIAISGLYATPRADATEGLTLPITGFSVGSWFDHTSPAVTNLYADNSSTMTRYDGTTGWSYNGHAGLDYPTNQQTGYNVVAADLGQVSNGEVYTRLKYGGSWGGWVDAGGGNTLTGSLAITTRPNGLYHMAALRYDNRVFVTCSTTGVTWTWGWSDVTPPPPANSMTDSVAVDNDAASPIGGCPQFAPPQPGVVVLAFSSAVAYVRCWELYCSGWEWIGGTVGAPGAISNAVNPYDGNIRWIDVAVRSADNELHRNRVY